MIGKSKAIELMVTGNTFSFEEALDLGLVNQVIDATPEQWWEQVMDYARQFAPPNKASKAVGRIKRSVQSGWDLPLESALAIERELQQLLFQSEDAKEGIAANQEKRVPKFKGNGSSLKTDLFIDGAFVPLGDPASASRPSTRPPARRSPRSPRPARKTSTAPSRPRAPAFESGPWAAMKPRQRGRILMRAADLLLSRADEFGKVETQDNGKPIFEAAKIDMPAAAECLSYFGEYADKLYGDTLPRRAPTPSC